MLLGLRGLEILESFTLLSLADNSYIDCSSLVSITVGAVFHGVLIECFETIKKHLRHLFIFFILFLLFIVLFLLNSLPCDLKLLFSCFLPLNESCPNIEVPFVLLNSVMSKELLEMLLHSQFGLF